MKRKYIWIVLLLLLALLISACGGDEAEETPTEEPSTGQEAEQPEEAEEAEEPEEAMGPVRVAAIMPSATNDLAFSQSWYCPAAYSRFSCPASSKIVSSSCTVQSWVEIKCLPFNFVCI